VSAASPAMGAPLGSPKKPEPEYKPAWGCGVVLLALLIGVLGAVIFLRREQDGSVDAAPVITAEPSLERELRELDRRVRRLEVDRVRPCGRGGEERSDFEDEQLEREELRR
jgi:hypothetical protein